MTKKKKVIAERKCSYCGQVFEVYEDNPQKEYCQGLCWCKANNIDEEKCRHYMGGHKNVKRKK